MTSFIALAPTDPAMHKLSVGETIVLLAVVIAIGLYVKVLIDRWL